MPILFLTSCEFYFPWCMHTQMVLTLNKEKYISVSFAPGFGVRSKRERWGPLPQVWRSTVCIYIFLSEWLTQYAYVCLSSLFSTKTFLRVELKYPSKKRYFLSSTFLFIYFFFFGCWVLLGSFASWASFMAAENF